jgi:hypothetical protein
MRIKHATLYPHVLSAADVLMHTFTGSHPAGAQVHAPALGHQTGDKVLGGACSGRSDYRTCASHTCRSPLDQSMRVLEGRPIACFVFGDQSLSVALRVRINSLSTDERI